MFVEYFQLIDDWKHQVRWQSSDFPGKQQLIISSEAANTFMLIRSLRTSAQIPMDLVAGFLKHFVKPLADGHCSLNILERSSSTIIESMVVDGQADSNAKGGNF